MGVNFRNGVDEMGIKIVDEMGIDGMGNNQIMGNISD